MKTHHAVLDATSVFCSLLLVELHLVQRVPVQLAVALDLLHDLLSLSLQPLRLPGRGLALLLRGIRTDHLQRIL